MKKIKKLLSVCALSLVMALSACLFVACGEEAVELSSSHISLEYISVAYDGTEKKPTVKVTVDEVEIDAEEYTVEYSDNINVGTASVKVVAAEDSKVLTGSVSVGFEITQVVTSAATFNQLEANLASVNYSGVTLTEDITIASDKTLEIPEGKTVFVGDKTLTVEGVLENNGTLNTNTLVAVNGTFTNNGEYVVNVNTYEKLVAATYKATTIVFTDNIVGGSTTDYEIIANNTNGDVNFVIDLNGKSLEDCMFIKAQENKELKLTIKNGTVYSRNEDWAIAVGNSTGGKSLEVNVEDVTAFSYHSGLQTNGTLGQVRGKITAKNCTFGIEDGTDYGFSMSRSGVYFPGYHDYRIENCTMIGMTGAYAKSGYQKFINCTMNGKLAEYVMPVYDGNGWSATGSALVVDSSESYQAPVEVEVDGGTLTSVAGFAVEEIITYESQAIDSYSEITYKNNPIMTAGDGYDAIAPLYVMDITQISIPAIGELIVNMGTAAGTKQVEAGSYTIAEFEEETESDFDFYIYVGDLINDVEVHTFSCDNIHNYSINDKTGYEIISDSGIVIEDRVFYIDSDGKIYVAASVLAEEFSRGAAPTNIYVNGKPFPITY